MGSTTTAFTRMRRTAGRLVAAGSVMVFVGLPFGGTAGVASTPPPPRGSLPPVVLDRPMRGAAAVAALGARLPAVAALNGRSAARVEKLLREDPTAWLDRRGRIYFVDPAPSPNPEPAAAPAPSGAYPYSQTFLLHSLPGAQRTIYLDFDGATVSGTAWNEWNGLPASPLPPYDTDGNPGSFSPGEQDAIQRAWARVAEDFAPFAVDVTTEPPTTAALDRTDAADQVYGVTALITPSPEAMSEVCGSCGGVAYFSAFNAVAPDHAYLQPAFVFPTAGWTAADVATVVSHEVGHNLGLDHDGTTAGVGYYPGHGSWAPIMGLGYDRPITQWSKGEYADANNPEDDLAIIATGAPLRPDDHGDKVGAATALTAGVPRGGVITTPTDRDVFSFAPACVGDVSLTVSPAPTGPDLDAKLWLLTSGSSAIAVSDPVSASVDSETASGLSASITRSLPPGTYYAVVDGTGALDPATTGYSDYGSLGAYTITQSCAGWLTLSGTVRDGSGNPVRGAAVALNRSGSAPVTVYTDSTGTYSLGGLPPADYSLQVDAVCKVAQTHPVTVAQSTVVDLTLANDPAACDVAAQTWLSGTTTLPLTGDDATTAVALPFPYRFYGTDYTTAHVATDGYLSFTGLDPVYGNTSIPNPAVPNAAVYGFWDDLLVDGSSSVLTATSGSPGSRIFVIEWRNVARYGDGSRFSFEVVLYEDRSRRILVQYKDVDQTTAESGNSATVGKEDAAGSRASQVSFNRGVIYDGLSLRMPK